MRNQSYGQHSKFTIVDRLGLYLSQRMILKHFDHLKSKAIVMLDLGCGYHAPFLKKLASRVSLAYGIDLAVSPDVKSLENTRILEGSIETSLPKMENTYFDFILMNSVLEHLDDPLLVLKQCYRILKDDSLFLLNVPTWRGRIFLETSAFVFRLSPQSEVNDHKMYYDKKDLWPLLIKAGFKPGGIRMKYHKFGLNLYAVCKKSKERIYP
ncbi:MAG: class I SAM-dependent methyltransferase [Candidatus Omnitrophica bacterium]|nr:class I SAM-dependent methyltransferase [Candidatus Omnitrophota bacterium]